MCKHSCTIGFQTYCFTIRQCWCFASNSSTHLHKTNEKWVSGTVEDAIALPLPLESPLVLVRFGSIESYSNKVRAPSVRQNVWKKSEDVWEINNYPQTQIR